MNATLVVAEAILVESTLSFLGFGIQPPDAELGQPAVRLDRERRRTGGGSPCSRALAIFLTVLAVNFVGDGLRDAFDPRRRVQSLSRRDAAFEVEGLRGRVRARCVAGGIRAVQHVSFAVDGGRDGGGRR